MNVLRTLLLFAVFVFVCACGQSPSANTPLRSESTPTDPEKPSAAASVDVMAEGRKLYLANCAACHKEDGRGGRISIEGKSIDPDDLTSAKIKGFPDEKIYGYIYNGIEDDGMPASKDDLSEAEIREVVRYLRSEIQKMPLAAPTKRTAGVD